MIVSIVGWITGAALIAASILFVLGAYLERSEDLCRENCTDPWFTVAVVLLGLLGAGVSVSINQIVGSRPPYIKRLIGVGGAIYVIGSIALVFGALAAIPLALVFLLAALVIAIMIASVLSRQDSSPGRGSG